VRVDIARCPYLFQRLRPRQVALAIDWWAGLLGPNFNPALRFARMEEAFELAGMEFPQFSGHYAKPA
jgi:hypothetical protein